MKVTKCDICGDELEEPFDGSYVVFEWREKKPGTLELCEMDVCPVCGRNINNYISLLKENRGGKKQSE